MGEAAPRDETAFESGMARAAAPAVRFELLPETFPRSARDLEARGFGPIGAALLVAAVLLAAWVSWFLGADVSVVVTSASARVEVEGAARSVETRVGGLVAATHLALDMAVAAGDLLVELETSAEELQLEEQRALETALRRQIARIEDEIAGHGRAIAETDTARRLAFAEGKAETRARESAARLAEREAERAGALRGEALVSQAELQRQRAEAVARRAEARGRRIGVARLASERHAALAGMHARLAELNREAEELRGELAACGLAVRRLEQAVEDRRIRAPVAGRIVDIAGIGPGQVVGARTSFATIAPDGPLRVVASFVPGEAVGRVQVGQPARLRLDGFPWTQYGAVAAHVTAVGLEPRDGRIRAELRLAADVPRGITLLHGLTGTVEVDVERVSPAVLVLRSAAGRLFPRPPAAGSHAEGPRQDLPSEEQGGMPAGPPQRPRGGPRHD